MGAYNNNNKHLMTETKGKGEFVSPRPSKLLSFVRPRELVRHIFPPIGKRI